MGSAPGPPPVVVVRCCGPVGPRDVIA
ncbi:UNVERIFIED_CONTAM: hypothetical protein GTU68_053240 [Idotea baltica]|nr:hypothetical protein [Idotea baltica]